MAEPDQAEPVEQVEYPPPLLKPAKVGLPVRPFLYTVDQLMGLLCLTNVAVFMEHSVYCHGRTLGPPKPFKMQAHNIAAPGDKPEWRIAEAEVIRWMRYKGFRLYERAWLPPDPPRRNSL